MPSSCKSAARRGVSHPPLDLPEGKTSSCLSVNAYYYIHTYIHTSIQIVCSCPIESVLGSVGQRQEEQVLATSGLSSSIVAGSKQPFGLDHPWSPSPKVPKSQSLKVTASLHPRSLGSGRSPVDVGCRLALGHNPVADSLQPHPSSTHTSP